MACVLMCAGAREVVLLDREAMALQCAALCAHASGLTNVVASNSVDGIPKLLSDFAALEASPNGDDVASTSGLHFDTPVRVETFDWNNADTSRKFDVVLACDVLYEDSAVDPLSDLVPRILKSDGGRLLLADPPNRTTHNRERFVQMVGSRSPGLVVQECSVHQCEVNKLDPEMLGGITSETIPVQLMVFRKTLGNDTVGVKM